MAHFSITGVEMNRYVVLVDAGYLLRQSIEILSKKISHSRNDLHISDAKGLVNLLIDKAFTSLGNKNLLRVYWYDGVSGTLTSEQKSIVSIDDVQLRAGTINSKGQQKGVDSKIVIDLIELATNHAISDAMLVTGDGDLAIGVELAQRRGVRVAVLGVEDMSVGVHHAQSFEVTSIADRVIRIGTAELSKFFKYQPSASKPKPVAPSVTSTSESNPLTIKVNVPVATAISSGDTQKIEGAVQSFIDSQTPPLTKSVVSTTGSIDALIDKTFIFYVYTKLGGVKLTPVEKNLARATFRKKILALP